MYERFQSNLIRRCTVARSENRLETRYMFIRIYLNVNKYLKSSNLYLMYHSCTCPAKTTCQTYRFISVQFRMIRSWFGNMNYCCQLQTFGNSPVFEMLLNIVKRVSSEWFGRF